MLLRKPHSKLVLVATFFSLWAGLSACSTFQSPLMSGLSQPAANKPSTAPVEPAPAYAGGTATPTPVVTDKAGLFDWPVDDARLSRGFMPRKHHPHLGIDLAARKGTPILASQSGTVIYTGHEFHGYGKMVMIESPQGWATLYAHMDKIAVEEGQQVTQGQVLGGIGRTGHATGYHLHFEIRKDRGPVDPLPLLPQVPHVASSGKARVGDN